MSWQPAVTAAADGCEAAVVQRAECRVAGSGRRRARAAAAVRQTSSTASPLPSITSVDTLSGPASAAHFHPLTVSNSPLDVKARQKAVLCRAAVVCYGRTVCTVVTMTCSVLRALPRVPYTPPASHWLFHLRAVVSQDVSPVLGLEPPDLSPDVPGLVQRGVRDVKPLAWWAACSCHQLPNGGQEGAHEAAAQPRCEYGGEDGQRLLPLQLSCSLLILAAALLSRRCFCV
jgi:hypothetical protein